MWPKEWTSPEPDLPSYRRRGHPRLDRARIDLDAVSHRSPDE
jgi:hypothetical protein